MDYNNNQYLLILIILPPLIQLLLHHQEEDEDIIVDETRLAEEMNSAAEAKGGPAAAADSKLVKDIMSRQAEQEAAGRSQNKVNEVGKYRLYWYSSITIHESVIITSYIILYHLSDNVFCVSYIPVGGRGSKGLAPGRRWGQWYPPR